ncbi:MAG: hypothetical protein HDT28_01010 [Clostridiales bacterium]|nr:hypothetical protein [Clostridiales bacterium]
MTENDILKVSGETFLRLPVVDTSLALHIVKIEKCEQVKAKLLKLYSPETEVTADGKKSTVGALSKFNEVSLSAQPDFDKGRYNAADCVRVIEMLTKEDGGCPWDKAQTHESIRINMIEEAYEAVDAIDKRDIPNMREEFGDVFLQALLHSDISRRAGEFDFDDVCDELSKKLIDRHSWIFAGDSATTADEALTVWEKNKGVEKHYDTVKNQLERLPDSFPSLLYAQKTYKKMKKGGIAVDAQAELKKALDAHDYTAAIDACVMLLADEGKDGEVELNTRIKNKIKSL